METTKKLTTPGLLRRLAAILYDTFLVLPLIMVSVAIGLGLTSLVTGDSETQLNIYIVRLIAMLALIVFFGSFWLKSGQTLGMQAWRIKLVARNGAPITPQQVIFRCLGATLSATVLGLGYLWCLVDKNKRCWHDYLSGTELVLIPKTTSPD